MKNLLDIVKLTNLKGSVIKYEDHQCFNPKKNNTKPINKNVNMLDENISDDADIMDDNCDFDC